MITIGISKPFRAKPRRLALRRLAAIAPDGEGTSSRGTSCLLRAEGDHGVGPLVPGIQSTRAIRGPFVSVSDAFHSSWLRGTLHLEQGDLGAAHQEFVQAEWLAVEQRDQRATASCCLTLGVLAHFRVDNASALRYFMRAEALFPAAGAFSEQAETLQWLVGVLLEQRQPEEARVTADRAIGAAERGGGEALSMALCHLAAADVELGDLRLARARAQMAADIARREGDSQAAVEAFRLLSVVARKDGDRDLWYPLVGTAVTMARALDDPWFLRAVWSESAAGADSPSERLMSLGQAERACRRLGAIGRAEIVAGRRRAEASREGGSEAPRMTADRPPVGWDRREQASAGGTS